jgi:hypothetical protein
MFAPDGVALPRSFESALSKLRHDRPGPNQNNTRLNTQSVTEYLKYFNKYGTHFVTKVFAGDTIYQVFAYSKQRFEDVKTHYVGRENELVSSVDAIYFRQYTVSENAGSNGYVVEYGNILSMSNDPRIAQSVSENKWHEATWSQTNSVFAPFSSTANTISFPTMNRDFRQVVAIGFEISPMALFVEHFRAQVWMRIFKGAMYQKYGDAIQPDFARLERPDFKSIFPEDYEGFLSTIATPTIDTYKTRLDLDEMTLVAETEVKHFNIATQVLQLSGKKRHSIPGERVVFFTHIVDAAASENGKAPKIKLSNQGYDNLSLACQDFFGVVVLVNASQTRWNAIVDGLMYGLGDSDTHNNRYEVHIERDVRSAPHENVLVANLHNLEFSLVTADLVMTSGTSMAQDILKRYLEWIGEIIPDDTENQALQELQVRVLELARVARNLSDHTYVPTLDHTQYNQEVGTILNLLKNIERKVVENQTKIRDRKQAELTADIGTTLNVNIIQTGKLLMDITKANAAQQEDMARYYGKLIERGQADLIKQKASMDELRRLVSAQKYIVEDAVNDYKQAVQDWMTHQAIKFALETATALFTAGISIGIPVNAITAVEALGRTAQKIQKALDVLNSVFNIYDTSVSTAKDFQAAQHALQALNSLGIEFLSVREWDEMAAHMLEILNTGPSVTVQKEKLRKEFAILLIRGKALLEAQTNAQQNSRDIYFWHKQQQVYQQQQTRLTAMEGQLHPATITQLDRTKIDLVGLTGELLFIQCRMLAQLAKAFVRKDLALQYETLQPPTGVSAFSLLRLQSAISTQAIAEVKAREKLARLDQSDPTVVYSIPGVAIEKLSGGQVFQFQIYSDDCHFQDYIKVRLRTLAVRIRGIASTNSGKYYIEVVYAGMPFFDRDPQHQSLQFYTESRKRIYEYEAGTDKPNFGTVGIDWSTGVNPVTPFSSWKISLPPVDANNNIRFQGTTVDIELEFGLNVAIEPVIHQQQRRTRRAISPPPPPPSSTPALGDMLTKMYNQGSGLKGWDIVFSMQLDKINQVLKEQFETLNQDNNFNNKIQIRTCSDGFSEATITLFDLTYSYPKLQFNTHGSKNAEIRINLLTARKRVCGAQTALTCQTISLDAIAFNDPTAYDQIRGCHDWEDIQTNGGEAPYLTSQLDLSKMRGIVDSKTGASTNVWSVVLDLGEGSFAIGDINISASAANAVNDAIKNHFKNNNVRFVINSLDLNDTNTIDALRPRSFNFRTKSTAAGKKMLQLYITTDGTEPPEMSLNNVPEPIPDGSECSIIISSRILFNKIMPDSFQQSSQFDLVGVDPNDIHKAWHAIISSGRIQGQFPYNPDLRLKNGNTITWDLTTNAPMYFKPSATGGIHLTFQGQRKNITVLSTTCTGTIEGLFCSTDEYSADATLSVNSTLGISIIGTTRQQDVKITSSSNDIHLQGNLNASCDSRSMQTQYRNQLRQQVAPKISRQVNISFSGVSLFAIKNLLFPTGNYISLEFAYAPGDLLILGTFEEVDT